MEEQATSIIVGGVMGMVYGAYGYVSKKDDGEKFKWKKLTRTMLIFVTAGILVGVSGESLGQESIEEQAASIAGAGVIVDMAWPKLRRTWEDVSK